MKTFYQESLVPLRTDSQLPRIWIRIQTLTIAVSRIVLLTIILLPVIMAFPIWYYRQGDWWINWLVWSLERAGPTFTKLGQWASSRLDLFHPHICKALGKLQSTVTPHSFSYTKTVIQENFGKSIYQMFTEFEPEPIGVGAVAQVYKARYQDQWVAVKVTHPFVEEMISTDLMILKYFAKMIELIPGAEWFSLKEEVAVFGDMMTSQVDLRNEQINLAQFNHNFKDWTQVSFPKPILCTKQVLMETFVDAIPMTRFMEQGGPFTGQLARLGLSFFLKMLVLDNHVHADLHPGNIFVTFQKKPFPFSSTQFISSNELEELKATKDKQEWIQVCEKLSNSYIPFIYIVDAGLSSTLSSTNLKNFIDLFQAVTEFNGDKIATLMMERSKTPWTVIDPDGFCNEMTKFLQTVRRETFTLHLMSVSEILGFVLNAVRKHHVKIEGDFVNVAISIMLIEGMGRRLDPDADLIKASVPFLRQALIESVSHVSWFE